jgi:hypothetical protein
VRPPRGDCAIAALEFAIGLAVVLVVLSDIFRTILLPRPTHRALRLAPLLGQLVVPVWLRVAARFPHAGIRQTIRGSLGPFLLVAALFIWVATLFVGFGLMLHATGDAIEPRASLSEAFYYAASCFLTLGLSPATAKGLAQVVCVAAGMVGLASVTVVATFLLSLQSELNSREVLVLRTEVSAGRPPTGLALLESFAAAGMMDELASLFRNWEHWSAHVLHSHRANPVLIDFRSADEDGEWLAVFRAVLDAAALVRATIEHEGIEAGAAAARLLLAMGGRTARDLAELMQLDQKAHAQDCMPSAREIRSARGGLQAAGYRLSSDENAAIERFQEVASTYRPYLAVLCQHLGIAQATLDQPNRTLEDA